MKKKQRATVIPDNDENRNKDIHRSRDHDDSRSGESRRTNFQNLNSSVIDGQNCDIDPDRLHKEKQEMDVRYQREIERLHAEKDEHAQVYSKRIEEVRENEKYKEDLLNTNIQKLREEKALQDKLFQERIRDIENEKANQDKLYEEKISRLRHEMDSKNEGIQEVFVKIKNEESVQNEIIDDKIQQLRQEQMKQDELYRIQLEKIQQDQRFKENVQQIKHSTKEQGQLHQDRQEQLLKEKEHKERSFKESFKNEHAKVLQRLDEMSDYTVASDDPDVRGWKVRGTNGETIGKIDELIVDTQTMKVRYLDIDLDDKILDGDKERHLLIPIGVAKIDDDKDDVLIPTLDSQMARKIPSYSGREVTRDYENTLLTTLSPDYNTALHQNENFYENKHFDDSKFYRSKKRSR